MISLFLVIITFHVNFEGGSLGKVEQVAEGHYRCPVLGEKDQDGRNRQASWYYFRIDGAKGKSLTLDLVDLPGEYNYRANKGAISAATPPWYSENGRNWKTLDSIEYDSATPRLRVKITPRSNRVWMAHVPPYTNSNLKALLDQIKGPHVKIRSIGQTPLNRDLTLLTITDPSTPDEGKKVIWLMFRQHSWEAGSSWAGEGAIRFLVSPQAAHIRRNAIFHIYPMCDPDGVARGGVRFNSHGFDLNRNWDTADATKTPEILAQRTAIFKWIDSGGRIDLFVTIHNTETGEYVDGPPDPEGVYKDLVEKFFNLLSESPRFSSSRPPGRTATTTTEGKPGRMTVHQGLYHARKLPAFLIELRIAKHPELGRPPGIADRVAFGADLAKAAFQAVQ